MRKNGIKDFKWIFYRQNLGKLLKISFYFYFIGTPLFFEKKALLGPKTAFPNFFFLFEVEPFGSLLYQIHIYHYSKCIFTIQGVQKNGNAMKLAKI